ncbi:hypothetical protein HLB44_16835 [Aquincola sp. S2]|uniref:DNA-binding protein n=1 Tax=Pseudaquabacterium terrae TaxID=2732868 RepID=A0ABX2EJ56_9BURK|nr:hypothetical protein [Aquabacterium terrae]NRF68660.1 hypothetical protein [Aquabacterium terrae]
MAHKACFQTPAALTAADALLTRAVVLQVLGIGETRLRELVADGTLPPAVQMCGAPRWLATEVRAVVDAAKAGAGAVDRLRALTRELIAARGVSAA